MKIIQKFIERFILCKIPKVIENFLERFKIYRKFLKFVKSVKWNVTFAG